MHRNTSTFLHSGGLSTIGRARTGRSCWSDDEFCPMAVVHDLLVLGRGLAGAVLAETAARRGLSVHVFDQKLEGNASTVAAGLVNPVVLRRDVPSWRAAELMALSDPFYGGWQRHLGVGCWHAMPVVKLFPGPHEVLQWQKAMARPEMEHFLASRPEPEVDTAPLHRPHGYGTVLQAARLDVPTLLDAQREILLQEGKLTEERVAEEDIIGDATGVRIGDRRGRWLVRCTGAFHALPGLVPVKGEVLTMDIPGLQLTRTVHRGVFLMPTAPGLFHVGSTFAWEDVWSGPTAMARKHLTTRLADFLDAPASVHAHRAGVRPASKDRRPILGITGRNEAVLNGLGSRGVMLAPWCAQQLCDHLFAGSPLPAEVDVRRVCAQPD